jgi:hypothetical protein
MKTTIDLWHKVWPDPGAFVRASAQDLERFEALVRDDQRQIDAKVCESLPMQQEIDVRDECAAAIRARGNT